MCVKQVNDKAARSDDIQYEFQKNGREVVIDRMTE